MRGINTVDAVAYVAPPPSPPPEPAPTPPPVCGNNPEPSVLVEPTPQPPVPEPPTDPLAWMVHLDATKSGMYEAKDDGFVYDLSGVGNKLPYSKNQRVDVAGMVTKDGKNYYRTKQSIKRNTWYGFPEDVLTLKYLDAEMYSFKVELDALHKNLTGRQRVLAIVGSIVGFLHKINPLRLINKKKQEEKK